MNALRPVWAHLFKYDWKFGLFLILLFGIPRFILALEANVSGSYQLVFYIFMAMWFTPWIFLTRLGRKDMGIRKPANWLWLLYAFSIGIFFCSIMYFVSDFLFGYTISNSFVYLSRPYTIPNPDLAIFAIFASIAMTPSPIGEELFYRGVVHGSFAGQYGETTASRFDSLAFAVTHLAHFGIIYYLGKWEFLFIPAILWILGMFVLCRLFFVCR